MATLTTPRTAVVIVHGMGEQLPLETLNKFVKAALPRIDNRRIYYSRPERVTASYEERRHLAPRIPRHGPPVQGQTEFYEYHWSYLMTGNKLGDLLPTLRRMLLQRPSTVPYGLKGVWWLAWVLIAVLAVVLVVALLAGAIDELSLKGVLTVLVGEGILSWLALRLLNRAGNAVTRTFVDVIRYLDTSPRSFEARRAIRKGMLDLLRGLHDLGRYSRVVVVGHSLGSYIAYDALSYLWPQTANLHAGPVPAPPGADEVHLPGLAALEEAAAAVLTHPVADLTPQQSQELDAYQQAQFALWVDLRRQGNPWLVTDLVTAGSPMYFADQLLTRDREQFEDRVRRSELPVCPPMPPSQTVEGADAKRRRYGWNNKGREVLDQGALFAVVRWTNVYFPAEHSWNGDWFGGPLRKLFGTGIRDIALTGDLPYRRTPALAHSRYFNYPDATGENDAAPTLRRILRLDIDQELEQLLDLPDPDLESDVTR